MAVQKAKIVMPRIQQRQITAPIAARKATTTASATAPAAKDQAPRRRGNVGERKGQKDPGKVVKVKEREKEKERVNQEKVNREPRVPKPPPRPD